VTHRLWQRFPLAALSFDSMVPFRVGRLQVAGRVPLWRHQHLAVLGCGPAPVVGAGAVAIGNVFCARARARWGALLRVSVSTVCLFQPHTLELTDVADVS
jgi:hypothetical protein